MFKWYALAIVVILLDQFSKIWVSGAYIYGDEVQYFSIFSVILLHNTGAAFSFLSDAGGWQRWLFSGISGGVCIVLIVMIARLKKTDWWMAIALATLLGGAVGNLYDRMVLGYVVDFIVFHWESMYFPAFNVADVAICLGAFMLIVDVIKNPQKDESDS